MKTQIKSLRARIAYLKLELAEPYTIALGPAAVRCIQETIDVWTAELARLEAGGTK